MISYEEEVAAHYREDPSYHDDAPEIDEDDEECSSAEPTA